MKMVSHIIFNVFTSCFFFFYFFKMLTSVAQTFDRTKIPPITLQETPLYFIFFDFFFDNEGVRASLRAPRLIPRVTIIPY